MKIQKDHLEHIEKEINKVLTENPGLKQRYEKGIFPRASAVKDLQMRFCFDLFYMANLSKYACDHLYSYLNDDHIYSALKKICPKITRAY